MVEALGSFGPAVIDAVTVLVALVALRLVVPHLLALLARIPGTLGRSAGRLAIALRPGILRRVIALALGLSAPVVALPAWASPASASSALASPAWASTAPASQSLAATHSARTYTVRAGDTLWDIARHHLGGHPTDAAIARAWPQWYAANRTVIGGDPNLILPGMRLRIPDGRATGTSAPQHHRPASFDASSLDPDRR